MLPKRMRYYHGLIDSHLLDSGKTYDTLPSVFIITILPYDPFGQNRMVYTIKNCCVEVPELPYDDGAVKIFLYTKGTEGNPGKELRDMLKYIEETTEQNITNPDIAAIHEAVSQAKQSREVGINYMKSWEWEDMIRKEATAEGLAEGREEGSANAKRIIIRNLLSQNFSEEKICQLVECSPALVAEVLSSMPHQD